MAAWVCVVAGGMEIRETTRNSGGFTSPQKLLLSLDLQNIHQGELEIPSRAVGLGESLGTATGSREMWENRDCSPDRLLARGTGKSPGLISPIIQRQSSSLLLERNLQGKRSSRSALHACRGHWMRHLALQEEGCVSSLLHSPGLGSLLSAAGADQSWNPQHPIAGAVLPCDL